MRSRLAVTKQMVTSRADYWRHGQLCAAAINETGQGVPCGGGLFLGLVYSSGMSANSTPILCLLCVCQHHLVVDAADGIECP
jgi:hypothetical protein